MILISGHATVDAAIQALRKGACDYLQKPFVLDELGPVRCSVSCAIGPGTRAAPPAARAPGVSIETLLVGASARCGRCGSRSPGTRPAPSNVLITGESGTGKELWPAPSTTPSPGVHQRLVPVNCGAIPESLLESQLFGHVRGAFTSAVQANPGCSSRRRRDPLPRRDRRAALGAPGEALRVIEERQVWAVGATRPQPADVRIIASTNRDLLGRPAPGDSEPISSTGSRSCTSTLPPLRERREDIPLLAEHLIGRLNLKLGRQVRGIEPEALGP